MFIDRAHLDADDLPGGQWPSTVPAVAALHGRGLEFTRPVTILVGENGSGKSTLVEAIAEQFGLDAEGGRLSVPGGNRDIPKSELGQVLRLRHTAAGERMRRAPRLQRKGFFLRAETAVLTQQRFSQALGYWPEDTEVISHGEGFKAMISAMMDGPGLFVLDEPESALSFTSCLELVGRIYALAESGAQVVCATHSPILAGTPGAQIIELGEDGFRYVEWEELRLVDHWRRFLDDPYTYTQHFL
ncbi:AAA family ATPase [Nocardia sp. NPDC058176]|uniref:AAA family ATPase n=1 Tax=Nocardia sp. NPDC058176 TaxID=3346368 RepID=UPI0036DF1A39